MLATTQIMENILSQVKQLSPEHRVHLVQNILQTLIVPTSAPQLIRFGEFSGDETSMATPDDFKLAEWHPTDEALDGP